MSDQEPVELTADDWEEVVGWIRKSLDRKQMTYSFGANMLHVDKSEGPASYPLADLGRILAHSQRARWRSMVSHWVRISLMRSDTIDLRDLSSIRQHLRLRLYADPFDSDGQEILAMRVMEDAQAILVLDLPDMVMAVTREHAEQWGLEDRDLLGIALNNVVREQHNDETLDGPDGVTIHVRTSDSHFVASQALALEQWVDNKDGAIVAVPNRHTLLWHVITDHRAPLAVQALWMLAKAPHAEGPGSITPSVYWWKPGMFARIDIMVDPDTEAAAIRPPEGFADLLSRLSAGQVEH